MSNELKISILCLVQFLPDYPSGRPTNTLHNARRRDKFTVNFPGAGDFEQIPRCSTGMVRLRIEPDITFRC